MNTSTEANQSETSRPSKPTLECNICYEDATEPVTTTCGHIYCWPCIYKWLETKKEQSVCPVCNNVISSEKIIPIYARGESSQNRKKPEEIPKRPAPEREERKENPQAGNQNRRFGFNNFGIFSGLLGGFHFNFGNVSVGFGFPQLIPIAIYMFFNFFGGIFYHSDYDYTSNHHTTSKDRAHSNVNNRGNKYSETRSRADPTSESNFLFLVYFTIFLGFLALPYIIRRFYRR